uniref:Uncharacterized protein n=1 Tax=Panagrolaimus davidi TaxID=227884 RepID=A0A914PQA7_9BILA
MLVSTTLFQTSELALTTETKIVFNENVEFFVDVQNYDELNFSLHITNVKGTTLKTVEIAPLGQSYGLPYDENKDCFLIGKEEFHQTSFKFYVKADFEYKVAKFAEQPQCIKAMCNIKVSALRLQFLKAHECYADFVMIEGYENVKLKCFIKKTKPEFIDLTIERAYGCTINGLYFFKRGSLG